MNKNAQLSMNRNALLFKIVSAQLSMKDNAQQLTSSNAELFKIVSAPQ